MPVIYDNPEQECRAKKLGRGAGILRVPVTIGRTDTWVDAPDDMLFGTATIDFTSRVVTLPGPVTIDVLRVIMRLADEYQDVGAGWYSPPQSF